jgi:teichuronic acid biosynthesis glycosyltransferase TuaG
MNEPAITILMPIYNGIEFINESVESIKNQKYVNWILLIGINGHGENSDVYKKALEYQNEKIKIYDFFQIKGKSDALNEMMKYVNSNWVALLDVDDIWLPNKLFSQIPFLRNYDVVGTFCQYFGDSNGKPKLPADDLSNFDFFDYNPIINSSSLIKKELCFWNCENDGVEDYDMWLRLWKQNKKFYNVDIVQVLHRIHNTSAFNSKNNNLKVNDLLSKYK